MVSGFGPERSVAARTTSSISKSIDKPNAEPIPNSVSKTPPPTNAGALTAGNSFTALLKRNLFAVAGIGLLLLGFAFLFRSIHWSLVLPPAARIGIAWVVAGVLGGAGIRLSPHNRIWGQLAQGGAAAIAYLSIYVACSVYGLLLPLETLGLFALVSAALVYRALREESKLLGGVGFLGAYAAPLLALQHAGGLGFNLSYGLLVSSFALWVSLRKIWLEIGIHAHLCAAALAALTYTGNFPPLAPAAQQALLCAYLAVFLLWSIIWTRRQGANGCAGLQASQNEAARSEVPVLIALFFLTITFFLGTERWLLDSTDFALVAFAVSLGLAAFALPPIGLLSKTCLKEAALVVAALSAAAGCQQTKWSWEFKGPLLWAEGVLLTLTTRPRTGVRAWLARALVLVGFIGTTSVDDYWIALLALVVSFAMSLWGSQVAAKEGWLHMVLCVLATWILAAALEAGLFGGRTDVGFLIDLAAAIALFLGVLANQWSKPGASAIPQAYGLVSLFGWIAVLATPPGDEAMLQLTLLIGPVLALLAGSLWVCGRGRRSRFTSVSLGITVQVFLLIPYLVALKQEGSPTTLCALASLGFVGFAWLVDSGLLHRLWRLDATRSLGLTPGLASTFAVVIAVLALLIPEHKSVAALWLSGAALFLACHAWARFSELPKASVRGVLAATLQLVGGYFWIALYFGSSEHAWFLLTTSELLPVLVAALGVGFLFWNSRLGERTAWQAAAVICVAAMVKLLFSLGGAFLSPLGIAGALLCMGALFLLAGYLAPLPPDRRPEGKEGSATVPPPALR
jgi:hypothetical protein